MDFTSISTFTCKLRGYFGYIMIILPINFVILASIDRCCSTARSVKIRKYNSKTVAHSLIVLTTVFWFLSTIPSAICFEIDLTTGNCGTQLGLCTTYELIQFLIFNGIVPPGILIVTGLITKHHIKIIQRRIIPTTSHRTQIQQIDQQLTRMLLLQLIVSILAGVPFGLTFAYNLATENLDKSQERVAWEGLIRSLFILLFQMNYVSSFYIYLYSSKLFRKQFRNHFKRQRGDGGQQQNTLQILTVKN
ncbi:unnamed protein product [Didymodactylos carnosus]|uniref:G-protein coupled receptors family 1 profile domain-containing protein n=2 Tax=Didymodactylos carnosus TaxID=1234261 RepID=A0A8S2UGJ5_9BILA|nr:unnamed protein product [Didymodactylos carnosus]CAF4342239.1 unnamed protein product [Didymodactylos carnosus]